MFKVRLRRPSPGTVLGGLALIVATSGVAVAAMPGGDGTLTACISNGGGLRVIDSEGGDGCPANQTTVQLATPAAKAADAERLDGLDSTAFLREGAAAGGDLAGSYPNPAIGPGTITSTHFAAGSKAPNSDLLDDLDSSDFLRAGGKAVDADRLDGLHARSFVQGGGRIFRQVVGNGQSARNTSTPAGFLHASCGRGRFTLQYQNTESGSTSWVWLERRGATSGQQVAPLDAPVFYNAATGTQRVTVHARRGPSTTLWDVFFLADGTRCRSELTQVTS